MRHTGSRAIYPPRPATCRNWAHSPPGILRVPSSVSRIFCLFGSRGQSNSITTGAADSQFNEMVPGLDVRIRAKHCGEDCPVAAADPLRVSLEPVELPDHHCAGPERVRILVGEGAAHWITLACAS